MLATLFNGLDPGFVIRLVADEPYIFTRRFPVIILFEPISSHIPKDNVGIHPGVYLFQFQGVFYSLIATASAAVISVLLPATDTLDHHHTARANHSFVSFG